MMKGPENKYDMTIWVFIEVEGIVIPCIVIQKDNLFSAFCLALINKLLETCMLFNDGLLK